MYKVYFRTPQGERPSYDIPGLFSTREAAQVAIEDIKNRRPHTHGPIDYFVDTNPRSISGEMAPEAILNEADEYWGGQPPQSVSPAISKESLILMRKRLNERADALLLAKGNDYNAQQQDAGDTLFNLRICAILGIVPSPIDGILVRMSDKLARLVSLTRPTTVQKVADESLEDTVVDLRNYADYLLAMVKESKGQEIK